MWNKYEFTFIDISKVTDFEFWIVDNFPQIQEDIEDIKLRLHNIAKSKSGLYIRNQVKLTLENVHHLDRILEEYA